MPVNIIPLSSAQKQNIVAINSRVVLQPNIYYTCPLGKKARIRGTVICTGLGSAANASIQANNVEFARWITGGVSGLQYSNLVNAGFSFDIALEENQTLRTVQSFGSNAEFNVSAIVEETPK